MLTISALSNSRELNIPAKLEWNTTICLHAGCGMMVPTCLAFPLMPALKCVHQNTCTIFHCIGGLLQIIGAHVDSFTLVGGVYNGFYMAGCLLAVCSPGTGGAFATLAEWPFQHDMFPGMKLEVYHNHCHIEKGLRPSPLRTGTVMLCLKICGTVSRSRTQLSALVNHWVNISLPCFRCFGWKPSRPAIFLHFSHVMAAFTSSLGVQHKVLIHGMFSLAAFTLVILIASHFHEVLLPARQKFWGQ